MGCGLFYTVYEKWTKRFKYLYELVYRAIYKRAIYLVRERINDPLSKEIPHVILCGTATSETSKNFARFIHGENNKSIINILDLNSQPLEASRIKLQADETIDSSKIMYIKCNALKIPIADNSIDLIDTDYLMEFISPKNKQHLIKEWARVLSEDGAITTRMFLPDNIISRSINNMRRTIVKHGKIKTYESTAEEMLGIFEEAGLKANIIDFKFGRLKSHILKHIIAYKKSSSI